jgi:hypothetical protein
MNASIIRNLGWFLIGAGVGAVGGRYAVEGAIRKEYEESSKALIRAMERTRVVVTRETPAATEEELETKVEIGPEGEASASNDEDPPPYINHYAKAVAERRVAVESSDPTKETPVEMFVDGGINDYGISYIEEDEYLEEDGNFKGQITLVLNDNSATFFMDGVQIQDWDERVGDSILVDFYRLVPPNAPPVLYVRNHKRDEDYEVTRELP